MHTIWLQILFTISALFSPRRGSTEGIPKYEVFGIGHPGRLWQNWSTTERQSTTKDPIADFKKDPTTPEEIGQFFTNFQAEVENVSELVENYAGNSIDEVPPKYSQFDLISDGKSPGLSEGQIIGHHTDDPRVETQARSKSYIMRGKVRHRAEEKKNDDDGRSEFGAGRDLNDCKHSESRCTSVKQLNKLYSDLHAIAKKYDDMVKLSVLAKTYKNNPIYAVEIHSGNAFHYAIIVVDFGFHPQEWASTASALYVMERLLEEGGKMTENIQWFIIPMVNPDGYVYATNVNNLWRKNLRPANGNKCVGVNVYKNFEVGWDSSLSSDPCRDEYSGSRPFSEIESKAIRDFVKTIGPRYIDAYVSVHSCYQSIRFPHQYKEEELMTHMAVGNKMAAAMHKIREKTYHVGPHMDLRTGGVVTDFMAEHFHIPLVFKIELGDRPKQFSKVEDFHNCNHPHPPALMGNLIKECYAGLRALAIHLIETRRPYAYKMFNRSDAKRQGQTTTAKSKDCSYHSVSVKALVTLIALHSYRLVT